MSENFPALFGNDKLSELHYQKARVLEELSLSRNILCGKCRHGVVQRRHGSLTPRAYCTWLGKFMPTDLAECSGFTDKKTLSLNEMSNIAEIIDTRLPPGQFI